MPSVVEPRSRAARRSSPRSCWPSSATRRCSRPSTLASDHNWAGVWIGATAGMVLADGVAIAVGAVLHKRLPEHFLHSLASVLFLLFGSWLLFDGALGWRWTAVAVTGSIAAVAVIAAVAGLVKRRRVPARHWRPSNRRRNRCNRPLATAGFHPGHPRVGATITKRHVPGSDHMTSSSAPLKAMTTSKRRIPLACWWNTLPVKVLAISRRRRPSAGPTAPTL